MTEPLEHCLIVGFGRGLQQFVGLEAGELREADIAQILQIFRPCFRSVVGTG